MLTGVDVRVIVHELEEIVGSWIVNIYSLSSGIYIFKVRTKQGLKFLLIEPGKRMHLTQFNRTMPKEPNHFATTLRRHLRDRRINSVSQRHIDRIIIINIGPDDGYNLVIELFGMGNIILVSPENKIISAKSYRKMKDRDIHAGREFIQMPEVERDLLRHGTSDLDRYLSTINKFIPALNAWLGLGPVYSRYIARLANIKTKKSADITDNDKKALVMHAEQLRQRLLAHDYAPVVLLEKEDESLSDRLLDDDEDENVIMDEDETDEEIKVDYDEQWDDTSIPFKPELVIKIQPWLQDEVDDDIEIYEAESLNRALDIYYSSQEEDEDIAGETEQLSSEMEKLENQLNLQIAHQKRLLEDAERLRKQADALYYHFTTADELIKTIYNARKNNMPWEDIIEKLEYARSKGMAAGKIYNRVLISEGLLELKLPVEDNEVVLKVDFRKSLADNANMLYEKAKKSAHKAKGADIAIERTKNKIKQVRERESQIQQVTMEQVIVLKRRKPWYEKFHWTFTRDNTLIIAGMDATTNERLVKRYLDDDDYFLHADIKGAAATIIKNGGKEVKEDTFRAAATLAVSYSNAWKLKRPVADAYAVEADQVSMSAPTGQFLPKGGFMIYGDRKYINDVPLRLYFCVVFEKHWVRYYIVTQEDMRDKAALSVMIEPGDVKRGQAAKIIKKKFLSMVNGVDIQKLKASETSDIASLIPGDAKLTDWMDHRK